MMFRGVFLALAGAVALGVILGLAALADWVARTYDIGWVAVALLALPLIGAIMTLRNQESGGRQGSRGQLSRR